MYDQIKTMTEDMIKRTENKPPRAKEYKIIKNETATENIHFNPKKERTEHTKNTAKNICHSVLICTFYFPDLISARRTKSFPGRN